MIQKNLFRISAVSRNFYDMVENCVIIIQNDNIFTIYENLSKCHKHFTNNLPK